MEHPVRPLEPRDLDAVVELSLRAWAPVFESMRATIGERIYQRLYPDWLTQQAAAVREVCADPATTVRVGVDAADVPVGFVAAREQGGQTGVIEMLAVDPTAQGAGLGAALTRVAVDWMRSRGLTLAIVETGGDPGHAPARRTYERAGFTVLPIARYFAVL